MSGNRVWLYCRVAHDGPDSTGLLEVQRKMLTDYAQEHKFEIVGCSNDMENGLTMDRPRLPKFHTAVKQKHADVLLTQNIFRLGWDME